MDALYTAVAEVTGGRDGRAGIVDCLVTLDLASPPVLGGTGEGVNPEQLFAAAYGASFGATLDLEARQLRLELDEIMVTAFVSIGHGDDGSFSLAIDLHVRLPGLDSAIAERLMREAHKACPYSRMTRGNVEVRLILQGIMRD